jgi:cytoskeletal protein CcmA (bactofilin family)
MLRKATSSSQDRTVQPLQQSAVAQPIAGLDRLEISSISSQMAVAGKIICKGLIRVHGVVEGELNASNALIADGARVQGDVVAKELTIGGQVKGNIHALRVKLLSTAVVEGEIFHQSLSIDENAWFEGCSRPDDIPSEPWLSIKAEIANPQPQAHALPTFDDKGGLRRQLTEGYPKQVGGKGRHVFLAACIAIITIGVISHFALSALQRPTGLAYATDGVRIDPSWIGRSTEP